MRKTLVICDFCKKECNEIAVFECVIQGEKAYDICDQCIPKSEGKDVRKETVAVEQIQEPPLHAVVPGNTTGIIIDISNLPGTCYVNKYLNAVLAGKTPNAQHFKAKSMATVARALLVREGNLEIKANTYVPTLLEMIRYVNANPRLLSENNAKFAHALETKKICPASTAKQMRAIFNPQAYEPV